MLYLMKKEEIEHLASLSRIRLTEKEMDTLPLELSSILEYVSVVNDITADDKLDKPQVGPRFNVFRKDEVTNKPNEFSEEIIAEMPASEGRMMSVKKILQTGE